MECELSALVLELNLTEFEKSKVRECPQFINKIRTARAKNQYILHLDEFEASIFDKTTETIYLVPVVG